MILNLRGTHGSGKTYVSHELIRKYPNEGVIDPEYVQGKHFVKKNAFVFGDDLAIIGRYKSGMDGIFPQTIVEEMIEYWANKSKNVIWENVMVSANVGRWCVLTHKLNPVNHGVWLFFDTPLQLCIDRVMQRREESAARGFNHRQEDGEVKLDVLAGHWRRCRRAAVRALKDGIDVRWVNHETAYGQIVNLLVSEGEWQVPESYPYSPLVPWTPTEEEMQYVLDTAVLPWEPTDTITKVDFKSPPRKFKSNPNQQLGVKVEKWGAGIEDEDQLGTLVSDWSAYQRRQANRIGETR